MKYIFVFTFLVFSATLSAQCRGFSKENCKDLLGNYVPTGENNNVKLSPGDRYQFISTFYEGQSYRIATCASFLTFVIYKQNRDHIKSNYALMILIHYFTIALQFLNLSFLARKSLSY